MEIRNGGFNPESSLVHEDPGDLEPEKYNPALERIKLAGKIIRDTLISYEIPLSKPIEGYPQRNRAIVRKWRTRIGHASHYIPLVAFGLMEHQNFWLKSQTVCVIGLIYLDFIEPSRNPRQFLRRVHQIYPFFPKPSAK